MFVFSLFLCYNERKAMEGIRIPCVPIGRSGNGMTSPISSFAVVERHLDVSLLRKRGHLYE